MARVRMHSADFFSDFDVLPIALEESAEKEKASHEKFEGKADPNSGKAVAKYDSEEPAERYADCVR